MPALLATHENCRLHRFALLTAFATLGLLGIGGLVTSHGAGMAVPDWPNTFGYNMFFFPPAQWVGGIFYEHSHRLVASAVGLLTVVLALWLYGRSARPFMRWAGAVLLLLGVGTAAAMPRRWSDGLVLGLTGLALFGASRVWPRCEPSPKWLRRLGLAAFIAVVLQGVLGGLRVVLFKDALGIFHATLAQLFFVLTCSIALFTSRWWQAARIWEAPSQRDRSAAFRLQKPGIRQRLSTFSSTPSDSGVLQPQGCAPIPARADDAWGRLQEATRQTPLATLYFLTTLLILAQLILGAAMRHQHAGLSIPDFPLAYGKLWPAMDAGSVAHYNQQRIEVVAANPVTAFQIGLQMVHRLCALAILCAVGYAAWSTRRALGNGSANVPVVGQASRLPGGRLARGSGNAGETPGAAEETPFGQAGRLPHYLNWMTLAWLGVILTQVLLGAATIWSNKAADIATAHVLVGALSLALGAMLSIISGSKLRFASPATESAPYLCSGGVRPSPGAATRDSSTAAPEHAVVAAPGDGRTPLNTYSAPAADARPIPALNPLAANATGLSQS